MRMKKLLLLLMMVSLMILPLAACGGGGSSSGGDGEAAEADPLLGVYNSVAGEMMGVTLTGDDISGFSVELKEGGKASLDVEGSSAKGTYTMDGDTITLSVEGEELTGTVANDVMIFEDFMGMGLKLTLAKEGSDAANANYASEEEQAIVGSWKSTAVTDVLGNDASGQIAADACTAEFGEDKTGTIKVGDKTFGPYPFASMSGMFVFQPDDGTESPSILWTLEDGEMDVTYNGDDGSYVFSMEKQ